MVHFFKVIPLLLGIFFLFDLYTQTFKDPRFLALDSVHFMDVLRFHLKYPFELILHIVFILGPLYYYAFIRGLVFYENGFTSNKGFPFLNKFTPYEEIENYHFLHPDYVLIINTKSSEHVLVSDNKLERIVGILDQHNIQGNLASSGVKRLVNNIRNFLFIVSAFTLILYLVMRFGWLKLGL